MRRFVTIQNLTIIPLLLLTLGCPTGDDDDSADVGRQQRVLFIGLDGTRPDAVLAADTPAIDSLLPMAAYSFDARTHMVGDTSSAAGWTSIFTGVDGNKHGVLANGEYEPRDPDYPTFFLRAKQELNVTTGLAYQWMDIGTQIVEAEAVDAASWSTDADIIAWTAERIAQKDYGLLATVLDDIDHAGHDGGFTPDNPGYLTAIETADGQLQVLLDAIEARPDDEDWLVVLTTDHAGDGTSHGIHNDACETIWFVAAAEEIDAGEITTGDVTHMDVYPTVLSFLGLEIDVSWDLDGVDRN